MARADGIDKKRRKNWQPLCEKDPTPGQAGSVRGEARKIGETAARLREQAADLKKISEGEGLKGKYANDLKEKAGSLEKRLREVAGRYEDVGDPDGRARGPLSRWADELEDFQDEADKLWHKADQEAAEDARAKDGEGKGADGKEKGDDGPKLGSGAPGDPLEDLKRRYNEAADRCAAAINKACGDIIKDSGWENFSDDVGEFLDQKWVKVVFEVAGYVATGLAFAALFCNPAGWLLGLATALTAAILAKDFLAAVTGNGSWYAVGLDVLVLMTMGSGKAAVTGMKTAHATTKMAAIPAAASKGYGAAKAANSGLRPIVRNGRQMKLRSHPQWRNPKVEARRAAEAERDTLTQATTRDALPYGSRSFAAQAKDVARMRAEYPHDPNVLRASGAAPAWGAAQTVTFATGTVGPGVIPKAAGKSDFAPQKPHSHSYDEWTKQFQMSGSDY